MNTELRNTEAGRQLYNQLRLGLVFPGEAIVDTRRRYTPVNKDMWSWEDAMSAPDTPYIARCLATRQAGMLTLMGAY